MKKRLSRLQKKYRLVPFVLILQLLCIAASAQVRISGKITDKNGEGLPGISVSLRNSNTGAISDADGSYVISANISPGNHVLVFSGIGFKIREQAITIGNADSYQANAELETDPLGMDEVVVTGTSQGTTRRQLGSFISTVKGDQLAKATTGNVLAALQGKTPGAQISQNSGDPGGSMSVRLRGTSTINSSSEPLYIIDGVIVSNSARRVTNTQAGYDGIISPAPNRMVDINPNDIERIEVLNGAAAAAIYGSRANAGVVQIFTKRGSTGAPAVSFSTSVNVNQLRKDPGYNTAPVKFGPAPDGPGAITQDILLLDYTNTTPVTRYNYWDYIFRDGLGTDNNLSVRGGKDKTKYFASASYFHNQGIIKNTDFQRFAFRLNLDQELSSWASVAAGISYTNSMANEKPDGNSFFSPINSITIIGNFHDIWKRDDNGNLLAVGERGRINPVSIIEDIKQRNQTNRVISSLALKLRPIKDVTVDYTVGVDNISQMGTTYIPPYTYNASPDFWGGGISMDPTLNGYASAGNNQQFLINHELNATLNKNITPDLISTTQVGYSMQYEKSNFTILQGRGLAPFVQTVTGASTVLPGTDQRSEISINGGYLQQNFKFRNRYFLTAAGRVDGSSVFGEEERNQFYAKLSGSYIISDEAFWEKAGLNRFWDYMKIRAAYGESGNLTGIGAYDRFNVYGSSPLVGRTALMSSSTLANELMKPEKQKEIEIGTDMSFLGGRANLTFNWYNKRVTDLLLSRFIAPSNGFSSLLGNVGTISNKGIEIMIGGSPVKNKNFSWDIDVIYNRNKNKVEEIPQGLIQYNNPAGSSSLIPGYSVGVFYGFFFARDDNGAEVKNANGIPVQERGVQNSVSTYTAQRDANGLPTGTALRKVIGNPNPDWTGTLVNTFNYKKLSLRVQLDAVQGLEVWNADFRTRQGVGNGSEFAQKEHLGELPRGYVSGIYAIEEWRMDNGSFVKLREVSFTYNFGRLNKAISDLSLSLSGRNLISWDKYNGFDPETNAGGGSTLARGIDFGNVPIPRTFALTLSTKF
ncbi:MAG: SusC/RagA family TonB-linked outer membrane protein [Chitinophagaceae bacterium]|nr:SusC/RagA family TonB-linked outer membrane protein [Chitinophagaceae bacterium]MCW5926283.1 SusC/RagA family TonB-linked outer membrane protein [Chitinophagaceae bacterium]